MHNLELIQFSVSADESFHQMTFIAANPTDATHNPIKSQVENTNSVILFLAPICFIGVCASIVFLLSFFGKSSQKTKVTIKPLQPIPCRKCRYYNHNQYIQCAVHPSLVLTKEALNCSEYYPT